MSFYRCTEIMLTELEHVDVGPVSVEIRQYLILHTKEIKTLQIKGNRFLCKLDHRRACLTCLELNQREIMKFFTWNMS